MGDLKRLCVANMSGLETYKYIINNYKNIDLSSNSKEAKEFRTKFKGYYRVRRNDEWSKLYFDYFEINKGNIDITFNKIIDYCFNNMKTNKGNINPVEASFSSKMLATIRPEKPILDSQVLANMGLKIPDSLKGGAKLKKAKEVYAEIEKRYIAYLDIPESEKVVSIFNEMFPDYTDLNKTKKIDFFMWSMKKDELIKTGLFGVLINE